MCRALEVHLLAAPYVPSCASISLVTTLPSWCNSYIHHTVLTSFLSTWYEQWRNPWFLSASTIGLYMKLPTWESHFEANLHGLHISRLVNHGYVLEPPGLVKGTFPSNWQPPGWHPPIRRSEDRQPLKADGSHQDPSVLPEVFFWWKFLVNFRILWTQKKVTQKQTHFRDLQMVAFSVWISWGKTQLNNTLMEWKQLLIESFGHFHVLALVHFFCDESWPSSFWLGSIPDQQLTLLISKDECVMKGMRPFRIQVWNRILRTLFGILDVSTLLFVDKCHLNLCELGDVDGGDKATGRQGRKSTKVCGFFWMILQGFFLEVSSFSMIWEILHMFHPCFFLMEVLWFHGDVSPTCQPV